MENGISASLSNQNEYNLPSKFGYSDNMQESHPTVWVLNDEDLQRAHDLITELDELPETGDTSTLSPKQQTALASEALSTMLRQGLRILAFATIAAGLLFAIYWTFK